MRISGVCVGECLIPGWSNHQYQCTPGEEWSRSAAARDLTRRFSAADRPSRVPVHARTPARTRSLALLATRTRVVRRRTALRTRRPVSAGNPRRPPACWLGLLPRCRPTVLKCGQGGWKSNRCGLGGGKNQDGDDGGVCEVSAHAVRSRLGESRSWPGSPVVVFMMGGLAAGLGVCGAG